jgi:hypothetical protein
MLANATVLIRYRALFVARFDDFQLTTANDSSPFVSEVLIRTISSTVTRKKEEALASLRVEAVFAVPVLLSGLASTGMSSWIYVLHLYCQAELLFLKKSAMNMELIPTIKMEVRDKEWIQIVFSQELSRWFFVVAVNYLLCALYEWNDPHPANCLRG